MFQKIKRVIDIVLLVILVPIFLVSAVLIVKSYVDKESIPSIFGYSPLIVLSGSMETEIYTGDLVIVKQTDVSKLKKGDVIAFFTDNTKKTIVTHRIIDVVNENGKLKFETKGDNNNEKDLGYVESKLVVGEYQNIRFKGLGNAAMFLQTPTGMCIIISIPILILVIAQYIDNKKDREELRELRKKNQN